MNEKPLPPGTPVYHFGRIYVVKGDCGPSFPDSQRVVRFDAGQDAWQYTSISVQPLTLEHPHHWQVIAPYLTPKLARGIHGVWKGCRWIDWPARRITSSQRRRQKMWEGLLIRFFREANALEKKWAAQWRDARDAAVITNN